MSRFWILYFLLIGHLGWTQPPLLKDLDTSALPHPLIGKTNQNDFLSDAKSREKLNPYEFDEAFFEARIFALANRQRKRRARKAVEFSPYLYRMCDQYLKKVTKSVYYSDEKSYRLNKYIKRLIRQMNYKKGWVKVEGCRFPLINLTSNTYYYDPLDEETEIHYFYGHKPFRGDSIKEKKPVELSTYSYITEKTWKRNILSSIRNYINQKGIKYFACKVMIDRNTLNCSRIPTATIILILAANRTELLR